MSARSTPITSGRSLQNLLSFVVFALYMLASLLLVAIGVRAYRSVVISGASSETLRSSLGYVAAKVRALDEGGQAYIDRSEGVDSLVLPGEVFDGDQFVTRIYWYDGALYELYMFSGVDFIPDTGIKLMEIKYFDMAYDERGAFKFTSYSDDGETRTLTMALRTQAEAAP